MSTRISVLALVAVLHAAGPALADDIVDGRTASGALYRLVKPTVWNGSLVLYAHGFVSPGAPVALPAEGDLITGLLLNATAKPCGTRRAAHRHGCSDALRPA